MAVDQLHLSLSEAVSEPVDRKQSGDVFSDSSSEDLDTSHEEPQRGEEEEDDSEDRTGRDALVKGNPGWADAMAKVLRTNKPKRKKSIVLSKARRIQDMPPEKLRREDPGFEVEGEAAGDGDDEEEDGGRGDDDDDDEGTEPQEPRKQKKVWENKGRVKPDVLDRNRERTLCKIATKGVVQLYNAVREHQKSLDSKLREAGKSELKREKILKSVDKKTFLDVLGGGGTCKAETMAKKEEEDLEPKPATWKVLREDFMMGAKLKDWDKEDEDTER